MAVNKNFVVKNGLEVNTNLLVADLDTQTVGIGTTIAPHELHVVGGIGVTNLNVTGVATIANLRIGGISTFVGFTTFLGDVSCLLYTSPSPRDGLLSRMPSSA